MKTAGNPVNEIVPVGVTVKNAPNHAIEASALDGFVVRDCAFLGQRPGGSDTWSETIQLDIPRKQGDGENYGGSYPLDGTPCRNVTITGTTFKNVMVAVGSHTVMRGVQAENITIENCIIETVGSAAITAYGWNGVSITDCTFTDCAKEAIQVKPYSTATTGATGIGTVGPELPDGADLVVISPPTNIIDAVQHIDVIRCTITGANQDGPAVRLYGAGKTDITAVTLRDIIVASSSTVSSQTGMYAIGCSELTIDRCSAAGSVWGARIEQSTNVTVTRSTFAATASAGAALRLGGVEDAYIVKNPLKINGSGVAGLWIKSGCSNVRLLQNEVAAGPGQSIGAKLGLIVPNDASELVRAGNSWGGKAAINDLSTTSVRSLSDDLQNP